MADRGNRGRGRGRFQQQPLPNRGGSGGSRGGSQHGGQGRGNSGSRGAGFAGGQSRGGGGRGRGRGAAQMNPRIFKQDGKMHGFNATIMKLENETIQQSLASEIQQMSLKDNTGIPKRPAYGSKGQKVILWANYFELLPDKASIFYRYDVSILSEQKKSAEKDEGPQGKKLQRCMELLLQQLPNTVPVATDYRKTLVTSQKLPFTQREFIINYCSENGEGPGPRSPKYRAKVQLTGTLTFGDILEYLSSTDMTRDSPSTREEITQAMNIIIASGMKSDPKHIIAKNNKYFPAKEVKDDPAKSNLVEQWMLKSGLEAFRGFFMSVRAATGRILLNVQVQHVATWKSQPLVELLRKLIKTDKRSQAEVHNMIAGLTVEVLHLGRRIKKVAGLVTQKDGEGTANRPTGLENEFADATQVKFRKEEPAPGRWVTVAEYFNETYGARYQPLQYPTAPLVNVGSRSHPTYLPSEVCMIKELQTYDKKLSPADTAEMIAFAVRNPADNAETIVKNGIGLLREYSKPKLDAFGIKLNPSMLVVAGRILAAATIEYQNRKLWPEDASWNMNKIKFSLGAKMPSWTYLWIRVKTVDGNGNVGWKSGDFSDQKQVGLVVDDFYKTLTNCGVVADKPVTPYVLTLTNPNESSKEIDQKFAEIVQKVGVLLVILPSTSTAIYNVVKRAGDISYGVHTVSVVADRKKFCQRFYKEHYGEGVPNAQYHANVALKFNLKLGGRNQVLLKEDRGFIGEGKTMLVGLDVTHPAPGSAQSAPSVSSITASIDSHLSQWPADIAIQSRSKEMIEGLKSMFKSRLALWQKNQGKYPEEIIVYRDGVGDSMYELVRTEELPLIRNACREVYSPAETESGKPYITIIICGKRHHTRFYPTDEKDADFKNKTGGTKCGTVVDRGITEARVWDFYLQAHAALHGTARSAHYVVIHDEVFRRRAAMVKDAGGSTVAQRAADEVERLTHAMCYTFGRATKAVSLCPPAYYADIACERARVWMSRIFNDSTSQAQARQDDVRVHPRLQNSMFYI